MYGIKIVCSIANIVHFFFINCLKCKYLVLIEIFSQFYFSVLFVINDLLQYVVFFTTKILSNKNIIHLDFLLFISCKKIRH